MLLAVRHKMMFAVAFLPLLVSGSHGPAMQLLYSDMDCSGPDTGWRGTQTADACQQGCAHDGYEVAVVASDSNCKCASRGECKTLQDARLQGVRGVDGHAAAALRQGLQRPDDRLEGCAVGVRVPSRLP